MLRRILRVIPGLLSGLVLLACGSMTAATPTAQPTLPPEQRAIVAVVDRWLASMNQEQRTTGFTFMSRIVKIGQIDGHRLSGMNFATQDSGPSPQNFVNVEWS